MTDFKMEDYALTGSQDKFFKEFGDRVSAMGKQSGSTQIAAWIRDESKPEQRGNEDGMLVDAEMIMGISENSSILSLTMVADQIIKYIGERMEEQYKATGNIDAMMAATVMKKVRHMLGVKSLGKSIDNDGNYE